MEPTWQIYPTSSYFQCASNCSSLRQLVEKFISSDAKSINCIHCKLSTDSKTGLDYILKKKINPISGSNPMILHMSDSSVSVLNQNPEPRTASSMRMEMRIYPFWQLEIVFEPLTVPR